MKRRLDGSLLAIEAGASARAQEPIEIAPLVARQAESRQRLAPFVALTIPPAAHSPQLIGDALALRRLLANVRARCARPGGPRGSDASTTFSYCSYPLLAPN
jgi:hypothetical protein